MKLLLNAVIRNGFISRQLLLVMVLESVLQRNMVVLSVWWFFFLKIEQSPKPTAVVELCAYRLLSTAYLMNEDVREEELFTEEVVSFPGLEW